MVSNLIFAMTLAFGKEKLGDVFLKKLIVVLNTTHFLHSVSGPNLIARKDTFMTIVQKVVKAMIRNTFSSVTEVKPAYQKVNLFKYLIHIWILTN